MPILIPPAPPQASNVQCFLSVDEIAVAQGRTGQQLRERIDEVNRHWRRDTLEAAVQSDEPATYRHVPFAPAGTRRVRYMRIENLKPRTIIFDETQE